MLPIEAIAGSARPLKLTGAPQGLIPLLMAGLARAAGLDGARAVLIAADESAGRAVVEAAPFFAPDVKTIWLPGWDCLPYDRASPGQGVMAERLAGLAALVRAPVGPELLVTTVSAATQRLLPKAILAGATLEVRKGSRIGRDALVQTLLRAGYTRAESVADAGDFAVRGSLVDVVPPGPDRVGFRLDFFGDEVDGIRTIDPLTQLTTGKADGFTLLPVSELLLDEGRIKAFRAGWLERFGAGATSDPLYQAASEGRRAAGLDHFLPLFEPGLVTLFDWLGDGDMLVTDPGLQSAVDARYEAITDYYQNRFEALRTPQKGKAKLGAAVYRPLEPDQLYLGCAEWEDGLGRAHRTFQLPGEDGLDLGGLPPQDFVAARVAAASGGEPVYKAIAARLAAARADGRKPVLAAYSEGSRERITGLLKEYGAKGLVAADGWQAALGAADPSSKDGGAVPVVVLPLESGFRHADAELWTEQDMLGDRLVRRRSARKADAFLKDLETLEAGELVVHQEHGIGRYIGLTPITVSGAEHDTVALEYAGGDKLYVPVENLDVLSRYGSESEGVTLDKLGGTGWAQRKARMKERIREIAHELLKTAALRATRAADAYEVDGQGYAAFLDKFPWAETDDQLRATAEVLEDLAAGRPMDRLVCGDVGFGKTEVALRAAYVAAASGSQVAVICPTTLLARQHAATFRERFAGTGLNVGALSRLVPAAEAKATREGLADGSVDIVVGTHAILAKGVEFKRLGLVVVDEEQRFGVTHKERLKALRQGSSDPDAINNVHVLTLTATPIPRTLQMALSGIRELSVIATPPVDRLAVRTTVSPFDPVVVREALLREHHRGGQSFLVMPRISDLPDMEAFLREGVPEVRYVTAHGQMAAGELEDRMTAFTDQRFDVLVSTSIVESGIDIPNANTLIVHRADMFGLAQLYQLRGRVGRAKRRAYALLTTAADGTITPAAEKRLQVLASLDSLGAGFELASHDLDQRGAGNLLGDEQSGHIREVGFELYQSMLEDAILAAKAEARGLKAPEDPSSPTISVDAPVMIPEDYVPDLALRMALYRRAADLKDKAETEALAAEMIDRFGPLPEPAQNLLKIVKARNAAKRAHVQKIEVGPKGALVTFVGDSFPNPAGLVEWMQRLKGQARLRPDQKLFLARDFGSGQGRLAGAVALARGLAQAAIRSVEALEPEAVKAQPVQRQALPGVFKSKRR
jgi:transcription-repair coupling factor (superfamily II helicase)